MNRICFSISRCFQNIVPFWLCQYETWKKEEERNRTICIQYQLNITNIVMFWTKLTVLDLGWRVFQSAFLMTCAPTPSCTPCFLIATVLTPHQRISSYLFQWEIYNISDEFLALVLIWKKIAICKILRKR